MLAVDKLPMPFCIICPEATVRVGFFPEFDDPNYGWTGVPTLLVSPPRNPTIKHGLPARSGRFRFADGELERIRFVSTS